MIQSSSADDEESRFSYVSHFDNVNNDRKAEGVIHYIIISYLTQSQL